MKYVGLLLVIVSTWSPSKPLTYIHMYSPSEPFESKWRQVLTGLRIVWYFFSDVYPSLHDGQRPLDPPSWWRRIFEGRAVETEAQPINNDIAAAAAPEVR